jgi:DNA-directed RNA polymerase specialized sigma subunit
VARTLCREYSNREIAGLIDEWIHSQRDRMILRLSYVDGLPDEKIAEIVGLSPRAVWTVINRGAEILDRHLQT